MHIKKNDVVQILTGEDKGKQGRVLKVFPKEKRVIIEGINFLKRHTRPSQKLPQGGIIQREGPIHSSNVQLVCPKCNQLSKTGMKEVKAEAKKKVNRMRYCKKCGEMIVSKSS